MVEKMRISDPLSSNRSHADTFNMTDRSMEIEFVRNRLEKFQSSILRDVEKRMAGMIDEVMQEMRQHELQANEFKNFARSQWSPMGSTWKNRVADEGREAIAENIDSREKPLEKKEEIETDVPDGSQRMGSGDNNNDLSSDGTERVKTNVKGKSVRRSLPDKVFRTRESYLTALLEVDHMKTIYHIFQVIVFFQFLNSACFDFYSEGRVNFGLGTFKAGFAGIHYAAAIWLVEHLFLFTLYYAFKGWALVRHNLRSQPSLRRFWSHSCLLVYIGSQVIFIYVATTMSNRLNFPFPTASALLCETIRLLMKMHAFVRSNAARVVAGKLKVDDDEMVVVDGVAKGSTPEAAVRLPSFSWYLYFLFAPTLIYRDSYPRTAQIRWKFAAARFLEVVAVAFCYSYIYERHISVHFANVGREPFTGSSLVIKLFGMLMPSVIILLAGFYMILHSWLNFTSELLRFGDRMFYKDWWTSSNYDAYYRNWNVVVHDWLYEYIYKDFYQHIFKGSKMAASMTVFIISAMFHEHIVGFSLHFFFPVLFVSFGVIGVFFIFLTRKMPKSLGNLFIWLSIIFGFGVTISLYSMEHFARLNCPKTYNRSIDYLTPAVWDCYVNSKYINN